MRNRPLVVDAVAREAATELVVDSAARHRLERALDDVTIPPVLVRTVGALQQQLELRAVRELRRTAEAAPLRIEDFEQSLAGVLDRPGIERPRDRVARIRGGIEDRTHLGAQFTQLAGMLVEPGTHPLEHFDETRQAVTRGLREVGAREEGHQFVRFEKHRQRPAAAAPRDHLVGELVEPVQVRSLLAVHLDVDEQAVHRFRGRRVLEALVRHHVAPVAGAVADRQKDRLALAPREFERLLAPGAPVHRIVAVLEQVGARLIGQAIGHGLRLLACELADAARLRPERRRARDVPAAQGVAHPPARRTHCRIARSRRPIASHCERSLR